MDRDDDQAASDAGLDATQEPVRPTEDRSRPIRATFTTSQLEALSDSAHAPTEHLWPPDWISHQQAHSEALEALERVLDGEAQPDVTEYLERAYDLLDAALHATLIRAARDAEVVAIAGRLHLADGCWMARQADPMAVEVGGYRRGRTPHFMARAEGDRWLRASARRARCRRCFR